MIPDVRGGGVVDRAADLEGTLLHVDILFGEVFCGYEAVDEFNVLFKGKLAVNFVWSQEPCRRT